MPQPAPEANCKAAAAGVRAIAILLLLPALWATYEMVSEIVAAFRFGSGRPHLEMFFFTIVFFVLTYLPGLTLVWISRKIRREKGWAVITGIALISLLVAVALLISYALFSAGKYEYAHPMIGYEKNVRKLAVAMMGVLTLLAGFIRCIIDLRRAYRSLQAQQSRGFAVEIPQQVLPIDLN